MQEEVTHEEKGQTQKQFDLVSHIKKDENEYFTKSGRQI